MDHRIQAVLEEEDPHTNIAEAAAAVGVEAVVVRHTHRKDRWPWEAELVVEVQEEPRILQKDR